MNEAEKALVRKALKKYKNIFPCGSKKTFDECFTKNKGKLFFWFNTEDHSSHIMDESGKEQ